MMRLIKAIVLTTIVGSYSFVITDTKRIQYSGYIYIAQHTTASGSKIKEKEKNFTNRYTDIRWFLRDYI